MTDEALLAGAFELVRRIGKGGMGDVWLGRHVRQDLPVAIKVLKRESLRGTDGFRMFRREVQAQARLHHPGVVRVHEYGEVPERAAQSVDLQVTPGQPFLVMEFSEAGTLRDQLPTDWPACHTVLQVVLQGLAHAHARGVVHRDLKPENILKFPEAHPAGLWKLSDFGLAHAAKRALDEADQHITTPEGGTPHYMAPEQFRGRWRQFGPWTDLYQIGCVTFELVTGRVPYEGESLLEIASGHMEDPLPDPTPRFPVPDDLDRWIERMLQPDPERRFRRAADAAYALDQLDVDAPAETEAASDASPPADDRASSFAPTLQKTIPVTLPAAGSEADSTSTDMGRPAIDSAAADETDLASRAPRVGAEAFPDSWAIEEQSPRDSRLADVGLGLFGLREVPFVDRDTERDRIWEAIGETLADGQSRGVVIEGKSGIGKSRLAEWIAQRAHEVGACTILRAYHDRHGGPTTGLRGMVERWLRTGGLEREQVWEVVQSTIISLASDGGSSTSDRFVEDEARALTEFLRPSDEEPGEAGGPPYQFGSKAEQLLVLRRIFRRLARRRPLLIWLDDAQWGEDALTLANRTIELEGDYPAVFLVTVQTDDLDPDSQAARQLEELTDRPDTGRLPLSSLSNDDQAELVTRLLHLEPQLSETVCRRTEGNPLFAVQILDDWVSRDLLVPGDRGFRLVEGAELDVPDQIHDLWSRRLQAALDLIPEQDREAAREALEIAAALGRHVDWTEWRTACNGAGLLPPERLVEDELVERGLVRQSTDGWKFVHSMFLETLQQSARDQQRWQRHNRHCAQTLRTLYRHQDSDAEREARHWVEAGELEEALAPLLDAATFHQERGDFEKEADLLEWRGELLDRLGAPERARRRVENWSRLAHNCLRRGEREAAEWHAGRARNAARSRDWPDLLGKAANVAAGLAYWKGDYEESLRILDEAEEAFRAAGDGDGVAQCLRSRGLNRRSLRDFDKARALFMQARRAFEKTDDEIGRLRCNRDLTWTYVLQGNYTKAASVARGLVREAADVRSREIEASAWNAFGDIARFSDDPADAIERYQKAKELWETGSSRNALTADLNLAMAEFAASDIDRAADRFERLADALIDAGLDVYVPHAYLGLAGTAAAAGSWPEWRAAMERFDDTFEDLEYCDPDLVWLAERAGHHARNAEADAPARRMYELARRLGRELEDTARAEKLRSRIDSVDVGETDAVDAGDDEPDSP